MFIFSHQLDKRTRLFYGVNALFHAYFYAASGGLFIESNRQLGKVKIDFKRGISWANKDNLPNILEAKGIHAKVYETKHNYIFSSQNAGPSGLFEFAIVFDKTKALTEIVKNLFRLAEEHSEAFCKKTTYSVFSTVDLQSLHNFITEHAHE